MNLAFVRYSLCIIMSLLLFIACNQSRHIVSDKHIQEDKAYTESNNKKIVKLTTIAKSLIGKPYQLGSSGPKSFDCSGLMFRVFKSINLSLPRMAEEQSRLGDKINLNRVQPGDLLFFGRRHIDHVAMVIKVKSGNISVIHSSSTTGVTEQVLQDSDYWMKKFKYAKRVTL